MAWVASTVLTLVLTGPALGSERLPIVVATAVSILVLALLLEVDGATDDLMADRDARAAARQAGPADDLADHPDLPDDEPVIALGPGPLPGDSQAAPAGPADPPRASIRGRSTGASLGRTVTSGALLVIPALVLPAVALAQGGAPCPVGETCLPAAGVSAATATGAATMLALTFGAAGRFVSMRRDAAYRQDAGPRRRAGRAGRGIPRRRHGPRRSHPRRDPGRLARRLTCPVAMAAGHPPRRLPPADSSGDRSAPAGASSAPRRRT